MPDAESPTPPTPSRTLAVFTTACEQILERLDAIDRAGLDLTGREIRHEAAQLVSILNAWRGEVPSEADRVEIVRRAVVFTTRANAYLAGRQK